MASKTHRRRVAADYTIACICPMGVELVPVQAMLDEIHDPLPTSRYQNPYILGYIGGHNIVVAIMPKIGANVIAIVVTQLLHDFPSIRFGLLVGIGGGVPGAADVRLGDVVVSQATDTFGGVVQYDLGKRLGDGTFRRTGQLNKPPSVLSANVHKLQSQHKLREHQLLQLVSEMLEKYPNTQLQYSQPTTEDRLFQKSYRHLSGGNCEGCDVEQIVKRPTRSSQQPAIHYGTIGSANIVMKDAVLRDELRKDTNLLCVEMEAAGLMNDFPCLVIRGICDYADSHKNKEWQPYAAAVAAAYMKTLLLTIPAQDVSLLNRTAGSATSPSIVDLYLGEAPIIENELFIGRSIELQEMESVLHPERPRLKHRRLVLGGMGGIGKTQLAIAYAKRHRRSYDYIFWLDATSEIVLQQGFRRIAVLIFDTGTVRRLDDDELRSRTTRWLLDNQDTHWLLIFDNYDEPDAYDLGKYCPDGGHGSAIITTRRPDQFDEPILVLLPLTDIDHSLDILATTSKRADIHTDPYAHKLAERLQGNPMALATAGTFLRKIAWTPQEYLDIHEEQWRNATKTQLSMDDLLHAIPPPTDSGYGTLDTFAQPAEVEVDDDDDNLSIRTDNETLTVDGDLKYELIVSFVVETCQQLSEIADLNQIALGDISIILPGLLKKLSENLGLRAVSKFEKNSVIFLRHYRRIIARRFKEHLESLLQSNTSAKEKAADLPSAEAKVNDWNYSPEDEGVVEEGSYADDGITDDKQHPQFYPESQAFIIKSPEFERFLKKAATSMTLTPRKDTHLEFISNEVLKSLPGSQSDHDAINRTVFLDIEWCPLDFLQSEDPSEQLSLREALSITEVQSQGQAELVGDYIEQLWPVTGEATMNALEEAVQRQPDRDMKSLLQIQYRISNFTTVKITRVAPSILLEIRGKDKEIAEVVEQFAWLGSACRLSPYSEQGCVVAPELTNKSKRDALMLKLAFVKTRLEEARLELLQAQASNCWRLMLHKPVVARNFPIKARLGGEKGLEMPFHLMATLGSANQATIFDGGMVLKGFSSIFVPMRYDITTNCIQWHFACTLRGTRMSYWEADNINPYRRELPLISTKSLETYRHFVGWTPTAIMQLGADEIDYESIGYCGSNFSAAGCALERVTITGSHHFGLGATIGKWNRHVALNLRGSSNYETQISSARTRFIILYDTHNRRGWLVDGATALLYTVCAQLTSRRIRSSTLFQVGQFLHPSHQNSPDLALTTLLDPRNRQLPIFENWETETLFSDLDATTETKKKKTLWTFQDLVLETWGTLDQIVDYQLKLSELPGVGIPSTTRDRLEGFGLKDLIDGRFPLKPRYTLLKPSGRGWVDLTRKLNAITLMATNLGELIVPSNSSSDLCSHWQLVPRDRDYLAACIWLLKEICKFGGNQDSHPMELFDGIYWHRGSYLFEPCTNRTSCGDGKGCDRIQVLLPPSLGHKTHPQPFAHMMGAVLFGRSSRYPWRWPLIGNLSETDQADLESTVEGEDT